jgi:hypothetical protein
VGFVPEFLKKGQKVVERADGRERVFGDLTARGAEQDRGADEGEGDVLLFELAGEGAIGGAWPIRGIGQESVEPEDGGDVGRH